MLVVVALLLAACGGDADETVAAPPERPAACPGPSAPVDGEGVREADLDGDGEPDRAVVRESGGVTELRVAFAAGGGAVADVVMAGGADGARLAGVADLDRDGDDELLLLAGDGLDGRAGIWLLDGCDLVRVTAAGTPFDLVVGARESSVVGIACLEQGVDDLYVLDLATRDGETYEGRIAAYDLDGAELVEVGGEGAAFTREDAIARAGLRCGTA